MGQPATPRRLSPSLDNREGPRVPVWRLVTGSRVMVGPPAPPALDSDAAVEPVGSRSSPPSSASITTSAGSLPPRATASSHRAPSTVRPAAGDVGSPPAPGVPGLEPMRVARRSWGVGTWVTRRCVTQSNWYRAPDCSSRSHMSACGRRDREAQLSQLAAPSATSTPTRSPPTVPLQVTLLSSADMSPPQRTSENSPRCKRSLSTWRSIRKTESSG